MLIAILITNFNSIIYFIIFASMDLSKLHQCRLVSDIS